MSRILTEVKCYVQVGYWNICKCYVWYKIFLGKIIFSIISQNAKAKENSESVKITLKDL
jgi:hypothetical protein